MKRFVPYLLGLLLVSCTADEVQDELPEVPANDVITIVGGRPDGSLTAKSRAVTPPALQGVCQADKMQIWVYTHSGNDYNWKTPSDLTLNETLPAMDIVNTTQTDNNSVDRWAKRDYTYAFRRAFGAVNGNHFAIPALAYTNADASMFTVNTGANYTAISLSLTGTSQPTPELFFGRLRFLATESNLKGYWDNSEGQANWNQYGYFYYRNTTALSGSDNFTNPLSGHLYRIVSQINVNITEMPKNTVDHMELYMTNVPKTIGLYGTHGNVYGTDGIGRFYPITATTTTANCVNSGANTLVATTNTFADDEAHLSAFFLPSEVGGTLTLRVHYVAGAMKDADDNDIPYHDFVIHPSKSAFLTGDNADVYSVQTVSLRSGSDLYVYNATENKFYSYANVRVNISGKYENIAAEKQDISVTLELEPSYERNHTITIN